MEVFTNREISNLRNTSKNNPEKEEVKISKKEVIMHRVMMLKR